MKQRVCGYCAAAAVVADGPLASHLRCPGQGCACHAGNHIVTGAVAAVQRTYTGTSEMDGKEPA